MNNLNSKWRRDVWCFGTTEVSAIANAYHRRVSHRSVVVDFSKEQTAELTERCRRENVTVNTALTAAFIAAHLETIEPLPTPQVIIPFDIRRRVDPPLGDVFCMCVGSVFTKINCSPPWDKARALRELIRRQIEAFTLYDSTRT